MRGVSNGIAPCTEELNMNEWYFDSDAGAVEPLCYPCAMERLRQGKVLLRLYATDDVLQCTACQTVFELVSGAYVPYFAGVEHEREEE